MPGRNHILLLNDPALARFLEEVRLFLERIPFRWTVSGVSEVSGTFAGREAVEK
jgi:hypothetical protein